MKLPRKIKKVVMFFVLGAFLVLLYFMFRNVVTEIYCGNRAKKIVGTNWNLPLTPTEEEKTNGGFSGYITWGHRLERECWKDVESKLPF